MRLQCMDKGLEGRCREFSVDGAKIGGGCGGDARFILQSRQNHARKAGYLGRPVGHGSDRRTQKAEVCANSMERGPACGEARIVRSVELGRLERNSSSCFSLLRAVRTRPKKAQDAGGLETTAHDAAMFAALSRRSFSSCARGCFGSDMKAMLFIRPQR